LLNQALSHPQRHYSALEGYRTRCGDGDLLWLTQPSSSDPSLAFLSINRDNVY
jgi:hypothetical protein